MNGRNQYISGCDAGASINTRKEDLSFTIVLLALLLCIQIKKNERTSTVNSACLIKTVATNEGSKIKATVPAHADVISCLRLSDLTVNQPLTMILETFSNITTVTTKKLSLISRFPFSY